MKRRRIDSMLSVRFSSTEVAIIRSAAQRRGSSVSAFLRDAALHRIPEPTRPAQHRTTTFGHVSLVFLTLPASMRPELMGASGVVW